EKKKKSHITVNRKAKRTYSYSWWLMLERLNEKRAPKSLRMLCLPEKESSERLSAKSEEEKRGRILIGEVEETLALRLNADSMDEMAHGIR
ncbi:Unknown protein, partial [Striga hermonthica]